MSKGTHTFRLVALQHQGISHAVGQFITTFQAWLVSFLQHDLRVIIPEVGGVVLCGCRMSHVNHLFHQRQRGLHALHPCLRSPMHGVDFSHHLLAIGVVHLSELCSEHWIHLVLSQFVRNLHVGERKKTCREVFGCGKRALSRVGIEQDLFSLRTVVVGQQSFADYPFAEELSHLCFCHTTTQRQLARWRCPLEPFVRRDPHVVCPTR